MPHAKSHPVITIPRCAHKGCRKSAMSLGRDSITGTPRWSDHCDRHASRDEKLTYFTTWGLKW
jgi:hypothetical protein